LIEILAHLKPDFAVIFQPVLS